MSLDDNEIWVRRVLRVYRNGMIDFFRHQLNTALGANAEQEVSALFKKQDPRTKMSQWETMRLNAERARLSPEVSTTVSDFYELLGVPDFYNIVEKFFDQLVNSNTSSKNATSADAKKGVLRCMQQVKVFRDPNAHDVSEPVDQNAVFLCLLNAITVCKFFGMSNPHSVLSELFDEFKAETAIQPIKLCSTLDGCHIAVQLQESLVRAGVGTTAIDLAQEGISSLERSLHRAPSHTVLVMGGGELDAEWEDQLGTVRKALAITSAAGGKGILVVNAKLDGRAVGSSLADARGSLCSPMPVPFLEEYAHEAAIKIRQLLRTFPVRPPVDRHASRPMDVPVGQAIRDEQLAVKILALLRNVDLEDVRLVAPFFTDIRPTSFGAGSLSAYLIEAYSRGCKVQIVTRPPNSKDQDYTAKQSLLETLSRENIPIFVNERLHSKIYLFARSAERRTWIVGSHNMTTFAMTNSIETSMLGSRGVEYAELAAEFERIRGHRLTISYDFWKGSKMRKASGPSTNGGSANDNR